MTRKLACLLAACLAGPWPAVAQTIVAAQSEIAFVSKQMGVPIEGRFKTFNGQLAFDPRRPEAGKASLTIAMASAGFGASEAETEVAKPAWFDSARFPQALFQSTAIKATGGGRFEVAGKLTLKGLTQELSIPVTIVQSGSAAIASGSFTIKRLDFRIGEGEWADTTMVANEVQVRFRFALVGIAPQ
jgi:polyisoprenoid-binding protein YceI